MISLNIIYYIDDAPDYSKVLKLVAKTASKELNIKEKRELNVVICSNEMIKEYNNNYRKIDRETDVLSFPSDEENELGDVLISIEKATDQAKEYGHSIERELGFLLIHGILHCLGYDHIKKEDEEVMFPLQEKILESCNLRRNNE